MQINLNNLDFSHIVKEKYKQAIVKKWLLFGYEFQSMTSISKDAREKLTAEFEFPIKVEKVFTSKDTTQKYLLKTTDGLIECVVMNYEYGSTICISTQVGCRMGCVFCASGMDGLKRNLSATEMYMQVAVINRVLGGDFQNRKITNIVLMGSGEPLDNFDNVVEFLNLVSSEEGLKISRRSISLSTCGLVPQMKKLADLNLGVTLTISLHNPIQAEREKIMPIARKYSVSEVISEARNYFNKTGRRVIFEYTIIKGENDTDAHVEELKKIIKGFPVHINCIMLNAVDKTNFKAQSRKEGYAFVAKLEEAGLSASLRREMGSDIEGACGQLKRRYENADA
ncbi:MAG: 23S rRNA (adenine(2503)-C(2))-methyltransferase RlmN [Bacillota bacterium]